MGLRKMTGHSSGDLSIQKRHPQGGALQVQRAPSLLRPCFSPFLSKLPPRLHALSHWSGPTLLCTLQPRPPLPLKYQHPSRRAMVQAAHPGVLE